MTHLILHPGFSSLALDKLKSSGIPPDVAAAAGLFSVEDAKFEVHQEFLAAPALVFPYFDPYGDPIYFERDGEIVEFIRLRYLADPPAGGLSSPSAPSAICPASSKRSAGLFPESAGH